MQKTAAICIILLCILAGSCYRVPPGNLDYSLTAYAAQKLNLVASFGPFTWDEGDNDSDINYATVYIPDKTGYNTGFIIQRRNSNFRIWYRTSTGVLSNYQTDYFSSDSTNDPQYLAETVYNFQGYLFFLKFRTDGTYYDLLTYNAGTNTLIYMQQNTDLNNKVFTDLDPSYTNWISTTPVVQGAYLSPVDQKLYLLCYSDEVVSAYYECNYTVDGTGLLNPLPTRGDVCLLSPKLDTRVHYFYNVSTDPTKRTGLISNSLGYNNLYNFYWDNNLVITPVSGLTKVMDAFLSNSVIASTTEQKMTIYNYQGVELNAVTLGKMQFLYENQNTPGVYQLLFSWCLELNYGYEREYYFSVYTYPTLDFPAL